jgi:hypothetical protein
VLRESENDRKECHSRDQVSLRRCYAPASHGQAAGPRWRSGARLAIDRGDYDEAVRLASDAIKACELHFGVEEPSAYTGRADFTHSLALVAQGKGCRRAIRAAAPGPLCSPGSGR